MTLKKAQKIRKIKLSIKRFIYKFIKKKQIDFREYKYIITAKNIYGEKYDEK